MEVQILDNEYWWGGIVDIGMKALDGSSVCTIDPSTMGRDQSSPLFYQAMAAVFGAKSPLQ